MYMILTYFVSFIVMVIAVIFTLLAKKELEQLFRETEGGIPFHICNVVITLMVSFTANAVMTIYIVGNDFNWFLQFVSLLFMTLPVYFAGHRVLEKYKSIYRKYETAENGKVLVLNDRYLKKKKHFTKLKTYNAVSKEK
jgi:hypothetical protein